MNTTDLDFWSKSSHCQETAEACLSILEKKHAAEANRVQASITLRNQPPAKLLMTVPTLLRIVISFNEAVDLRRHCLLTLQVVFSAHGKACAIECSKMMPAIIFAFEKIDSSSPLYLPMLNVLSKMGYEKTVPLLTNWVNQHADYGYRDAIYDLEFLANQGVDAAWQALVGLVTDDHLNNSARGQAVESMKSLKDFRAFPHLFELMKNPYLDPYLAKNIYSTIDTLLDCWIENTGIKQQLYHAFEEVSTALYISPSLNNKGDVAIEKNQRLPRQYPLSQDFSKYAAQAFV